MAAAMSIVPRSTPPVSNSGNTCMTVGKRGSSPSMLLSGSGSVAGLSASVFSMLLSVFKLKAYLSGYNVDLSNYFSSMEN
jgi:hypothetical protein